MSCKVVSAGSDLGYVQCRRTVDASQSGSDGGGTVGYTSGQTSGGDGGNRLVVAGPSNAARQVLSTAVAEAAGDGELPGEPGGYRGRGRSYRQRLKDDRFKEGHLAHAVVAKLGDEQVA